MGQGEEIVVIIQLYICKYIVWWCAKSPDSMQSHSSFHFFDFTKYRFEVNQGATIVFND